MDFDLLSGIGCMQGGTETRPSRPQDQNIGLDDRNIQSAHFPSPFGIVKDDP
jgi:hypothetical protein